MATTPLGCAEDPNEPEVSSGRGGRAGRGGRSGGAGGGPKPRGTGGAGGHTAPPQGADAASDVVLDNDARFDGLDAPSEVSLDAPAAAVMPADGPRPSLGPTGYVCPPGPFPSPLPANRALTQVRGGLGGDESEGPLWLDSLGALIFTNATGTTRGKLYKYTPATDQLTVYLDNTGCGGLALDPSGTAMLGSCHDRQRLSRFDLATSARTDVPGGSSYMNRPFDQTNDLVVRNDGNVYFTDTTYQRGSRPGQDTTAYYRLSPQGQVTRIATAPQPNGIALSPDGKFLYVSSTGGAPLRRHPVAEDGSVGPGTTINGASSDGMAVDCAGNLYLTGGGGVRVLSPNGQMLGMLTGASSGFVTNAAFGDADHQTLYVTTSTSLYKIRMPLPGFPN